MLSAVMLHSMGFAVNNSRAAQFVTTATAKPAAGDLPKLSTGKTDPQEILRARVDAVFAEGFTLAKVGSDDVYGNLAGYQIANYWSEADYSWGHIDGAMQYSPKEAFTLAADLKTLATDKPVAVYCYTGQTSAHVAAYLRVLGYDAKSITFGVNGMSHDDMPGTKWADTEIHDPMVVRFIYIMFHNLRWNDHAFGAIQRFVNPDGLIFWEHIHLITPK